MLREAAALELSGLGQEVGRRPPHGSHFPPFLQVSSSVWSGSMKGVPGAWVAGFLLAPFL